MTGSVPDVFVRALAQSDLEPAPDPLDAIGPGQVLDTWVCIRTFHRDMVGPSGFQYMRFILADDATSRDIPAYLHKTIELMGINLPGNWREKLDLLINPTAEQMADRDLYFLYEDDGTPVDMEADGYVPPYLLWYGEWDQPCQCPFPWQIRLGVFALPLCDDLANEYLDRFRDGPHG